ncbi:GerMN domain-containing protein [Streptomyces sp. MMBL 11-3]|uniref:GerMN domain-containing protein n=1 Tax=Streptomyces sp. MMBL 11-3 TaxID=3382639 RepID=UPI0039B4E1E3
MRLGAALPAVWVVLLVVTGCGVSGTDPMAAGRPAVGGQALEGAEPLRVYFTTEQGTWPATRPAPDGAGPQEAVDALLGGPTSAERARGLTTAVPTGNGQVRARASAGTVDLDLPWPVAQLDRTAVSQLVCTAAAAPGVPGGRRSQDVLVRVHEPGAAGAPWDVMCDDTGTAAPKRPPSAG